ncbi:hypothetical protein PIB30_033100 [Stylosanthes scabra]|uniref:Uncharacterized protein n=1 Tax=Stylosanthes scabra TaxID=79078 RepID=A0ABU6SCK9_9FABA|nr:hypothetical protein [Stylosanthes scabra]
MGYLSKQISMPESLPLVLSALDVSHMMNLSPIACLLALIRRKLGGYWKFSCRLLHLRRGNGGWSFIGPFVSNVHRTTSSSWWRITYGFSRKQEMTGSSTIVINLQLIVSLLLKLFFRIASPGTLEPYFLNVLIPLLYSYNLSIRFCCWNFPILPMLVVQFGPLLLNKVPTFD